LTTVARRILVHVADAPTQVLLETTVANEAELQTLIRDNPDLLPVDEFGLPGPLLVVGRETSLPSGAVDLVALSPSGDLLLVEFKTGPQNPDFRAVVAQLVDYGSDLWQMTLAQFEQTVVVRYFSGKQCPDLKFKNLQSLDEAAMVRWPEMPTADRLAAWERLSDALTKGRFHYVAIAQKFTRTVERTVEYLNATGGASSFYAVELVHFSGASVAAFETRTVVRPMSSMRSPSTLANLATLLAAIDDEDYRHALSDFFEFAEGVGLRSEWGTVGVSLRLITADRPQPLTIAWVFPPGKVGWSGLTDVTAGVDLASFGTYRSQSLPEALAQFLDAIANLDGAESVKPKSLRAYRIPPAVFAAGLPALREIVTTLVTTTGQ
jgi:hypothetical protein